MKAKKKKIQTKWSMYKGPRHHLLVPSQYMGGGPWVKVFRGYSLAVGRNGGFILGFPFKLLWKKCPTGIVFHLKEVSMGYDHLIHAIVVGDEIA